MQQKKPMECIRSFLGRYCENNFVTEPEDVLNIFDCFRAMQRSEPPLVPSLFIIKHGFYSFMTYAHLESMDLRQRQMMCENCFTFSRMWLGGILHARLHEEVVIANSLVDGKLQLWRSN